MGGGAGTEGPYFGGKHAMKKWIDDENLMPDPQAVQELTLFMATHCDLMPVREMTPMTKRLRVRRVMPTRRYEVGFWRPQSRFNRWEPKK